MPETAPNGTVPPPLDPGSIDITRAEPKTYLEVIFQSIKNHDPEIIKVWAGHVVETKEFWIDLGLIVVPLILAWIFSCLFNRAFDTGKLPSFAALRKKIFIRQQFKPYRIFLVLFSWLTLLLANSAGFHCPFLRTFTLIVTLFFLIYLPSVFIEWKSWMRVISALMLIAAVLQILGLLDDLIGFLNQHPIEFGSLKLSLMAIIKGLLTLFILFWLAGLFSRLISEKIASANDLSPNVKVLLRKSISIGLYTTASLLALAVMGIKITALAVFGGAFGLGIGFGLQKVISNLVSGFILLLDKSVKPGDVIEIGNTYGWINSLNLRYASVITRDNKEHLIPNEDFITNPVINWTYSNKILRVRVPFGISYQSDIHLATKLAEESAAATDRVVENPPPRCILEDFAESSIQFELRFFIEDPQNGVGILRSEVLKRIWDTFAENDIKFPFPQRDVHLRIADPVLRDHIVDSLNDDEKSE